MLRKLRAIGVLLGIVLAAVVMFTALFAVMNRDAHRASTIVVGSKAFTESIILGEIIAQILEREPGVRVERRFNLGGTQICFEALRTGAIDLYVEYTGTGLMAILQRPVDTNPVTVLHTVRDEFARRSDTVWLEPLGFNNTYALAVPTALAAREHLRTISDLRSHPELIAGFATEFLARDDGWPGLRARYGLHFAGDPRSMEAGLMYAAAAAGEIDVISAYSTDGRLATMNLVVLDDDRHFFPPYQAVPLVRRDTLARHAFVRPALDALGNRISDDAMRRMNADVDAGRSSPAQVAREFLRRLDRVPAAPAR